jgi:predicted MFS family arabinose efflux permease
VQVLCLTLVMVAGAPIAGAIMHRVGPRVPIAVGMALSAISLLGLASLGVGADVTRMTGWFLLMGAGFSPVVIGATRLIISGAPISLAGVASGLQQTAMQVGGSLGTAVLGAVVAAQVGVLLPARLAAAGVELPGSTADAVRDVSVGQSPAGIAPGSASAAEAVADATFVRGMDTALVVTAGLALAGVVVALLSRPRRRDPETS